MKKVLLIIFCLTVSNNYAQKTANKTIKSKVNAATVFLKGAQITRNKKVDLLKGKSILKFVGLSPFIDAKSIQVKVGNGVTVLSVNHQKDFLNKLKKSKELTDLEAKLQGVKDKIELQNTYIDVVKEELKFLRANKTIGGKNQALTVSNFRETTKFYSDKITALKLKEITYRKKLYKLRKEKNDIDNQINTISNIKHYPTGEILVKVDAKSAVKALFKISYMVKNAGWYPTYDIRAKNINAPLELVYKANVSQDTKVDWTGIKLKFSSSNPDVSGVAPQLKTYYLSYNTRPPVYGKFNNTVTGIVTDGHLPLPGVNVLVKGTTIGTTTDFDGRFTITVPDNNSKLVFSYIGMETKTIRANSSNINVALDESANTLDEVVVTTRGNKRKRKALGYSVSRVLNGKVAGVQIRGASSINKNKREVKLANQIKQVKKQTTVEFALKTPFTIKSSNKNFTVDMKGYSINANYQYYSVPKINKNAYLIANIKNWEKYNLLDGEVNIFFEGAYVGKSLLDLRQASDTLRISLGRDKQVVVNREEIKKFTTKQFIGSKKEETKAWKISVKNNKAETINMVIYDQVPISTLEEIKVTPQETSGAKFNTKNGEVKWEFSLEPNRKMDFNSSIL